MSVTLTLILSGRAYKQFEFEAFNTLTIGRSPECDVHIDNLGLSRYHCEIVNLGGTYQIRDLQSGNGTTVNGIKVETYNINDGDVIGLGKFSIEFKADTPWSDDGGPSSTVARMSDPTMAYDPESIARTQKESIQTALGYFLMVSEAGNKEFVVLEDSFCLFGKGAAAKFKLGGWGCPRLAAMVVRDESGFRVIDVSPECDSVRVNGERRKDIRLNHQDEVEIRDQKMQFNTGKPTDWM